MSTATPTAPLPPAALHAMDHLELRLRFPKPVVDAVVVYETAAVRAAELAAKAAAGEGLPAIDVRSWEFAEELMAGARATLAAAGCLDLVAVSAEEHGKTKEPLPSRPRGPHPYRAGVTL